MSPLTFRRWTLPVLGMPVLLAAACAGLGRSELAPALGPDSVFVEARNDRFYDARVHAIYQGGQRRSLGTIAGNGGTARASLAWEPHALFFEIHFIVERSAWVSVPVDVTRGEIVALTIPSNIDSSGFFRRVSRD